jgi:peptidoglycan/LPS O-acetylase OafA/YrhL
LIVLLLGVLGVIRSPSVILAGTAVAGWCLIVAFLGMANAWLQRPARSLDYLRESAFPVYILHQPAVVLVGSFVVELSLGIAAKLALLTACSVVVAMLFYHWVARPVPLLRFALGMKPLPQGGSGAAETPALARQ